MPGAKRSRAEWLQEALLLEQLCSEWEVGHVAAFCTVSEGYIYRSDCPRLEKAGQDSITGKHMIRFVPAEVRAWNSGRTLRHRQ